MTGAFPVRRFLTVQPLVSTPPLPPVDTPQTIKGTASTTVDIADWLSHVPTGERVALSVTGPIPALPWLLPTVANGDTQLFAPRELASMLAVQSVGLSEGQGVGRWILTYPNAGSPVTLVLGFDVSEDVPRTGDLGARTLQRRGGYDLSRLGAGTWSLVAARRGGASTTALEVWHNRIVWAASGAGTYGTARVVAYGTLAAADFNPGRWEVDVISDTGQAETITLTTPDRRWDTARCPVAPATNFQLLDTILAKPLAGERLLMEDGTHWDGTGNVVAFLTDANRVQPYAGGPPLPTAADANPAESLGWVDISSRNHLGAKMVTNNAVLMLELGSLTTNDGAVYLRFRNIDMRKPDGGTCFDYRANGGTNRRARWAQIDHCMCGTTTIRSLRNGSRAMFLRHNDISGSTFFYAENSVIWGNSIHDAVSDMIQMAIFSKPGSADEAIIPTIGFNLLYDKKWASGQHGDAIQAVYQLNPPSGVGVGNSPGMADYGLDPNVGIQPYFGGRIIGNRVARGTGTISGGQDQEDFQLLFLANILDDRPMHWEIAGNLGISDMIRGIAIKKAGAGTKVQYNTSICDPTLANPVGSLGVPRPTLTNGDGTFALGYTTTLGDVGTDAHTVTYKNNLFQGVMLIEQQEIKNGAVSYSPKRYFGAVPTPNKVGNYPPNIDGLTNGQVAAVLANPAIGTAANNLPAILAALTPIGALAGQDVGGINSLIDHRAQTWNAALLT